MSGYYPPPAKGDENKVANPDAVDVHFHTLTCGKLLLKNVFASYTFSYESVVYWSLNPSDEHT